MFTELTYFNPDKIWIMKIKYEIVNCWGVHCTLLTMERIMYIVQLYIIQKSSVSYKNIRKDHGRPLVWGPQTTIGLYENNIQTYIL